MGDAWIVRRDEDGETVYLLENDLVEMWVEDPARAATFTNAAAKREVRKLGPGREITPVRRFSEVNS